MNGEMAALKVALEALGRPVHDTEATGSPAYPYFLLWAPPGAPGEERSVRGEVFDVDMTVGVTSVSTTPESVRITARRAREALCPGGLPGSLTVAGRLVRVTLDDSQPIRVDRDVTLTSGAHPMFGVDLYRLVSTPA